MRRHRTLIAIVLGGGVVLLMIAVGQVWYVGRPFDQSVWRDSSVNNTVSRRQMAERMLARRTLLEKSRDEVVAMLGRPSQEGYFTTWDLVYLLGPEKGPFGIDSEWLVVTLGESGQVSEASIQRD